MIWFPSCEYEQRGRAQGSYIVSIVFTFLNYLIKDIVQVELVHCLFQVAFIVGVHRSLYLRKKHAHAQFLW